MHQGKAVDKHAPQDDTGNWWEGNNNNYSSDILYDYGLLLETQRNNDEIKFPITPE